MKLLIAAVSLALISEYVNAGEFRALDFGQSCEGVSDAERSLGSVTNGEPRRGHHTFQGVYLDHAVKILYDCSTGGKLVRGTYVYDFDSLKDAVAFFKLAEPQLTEQYGRPKVDGASQEYAKAMSKFGVSVQDVDRYMRFWVTDHVKILLSAQRVSVDSEAAAVAIDFTPRER